MFNTPPTYAIYIAGLVFNWIKAQGGLAAMEAHNRAKAALLYDYLDTTAFYRNPVARDDRSLMNVPFKLKDDDARRRLPEGRRGARHGAAEGPPLGGRHARVDLQRDAGRGRAGAGGLHEGVRGRSMAEPPFRDPGAEPDLGQRACRGCRPSATRSARTSPSPTRSWCARPTCTRCDDPGQRARHRPRRRRHQQHPGRGDERARRAGVQRARARTPTR